MKHIEHDATAQNHPGSLNGSEANGQVAALIPVASLEASVPQEGELASDFNRVFCFGNAECDQFFIDDDQFESRRPVEVSFFAERNHRIRVFKLACGTQHTLLLTDQGRVFSWGNADDGCLGRPIEGRSTTPGPVELPQPVDLLSAGESHSLCANSKTGSLFIWGTVKSSLKGKLFSYALPETKENYSFSKKGIQDIRSGANHIVILSGRKAYTWGDSDTGALGTQFRGELDERKIFEPNAVDCKAVTRIFATANNTFLEASKGRIFGCGLNNYGQLGVKQDESDYVVKLPQIVPGLVGAEVRDIAGGEHHTFVLLTSGALYGAGRNDDGQLGILTEGDYLGCFQQLEHIANVERVISASHFNYAKGREEEAYYAWGFGASFVLANGREDTLEEARKINNEKFFTQGFPSLVSLGHSFVAFATNPLGDHDALHQRILAFKTKRPAKKPLKQKGTRKIKTE